MDNHTLSKVISKKAHKRKIIMSTITLVALFVAVIPLAIMVIKSSYAAEDPYGKMIVIGDSYSRGYMPVNGQYTDVYESSWPNKMMAKLGSGSMIGDDLGRRGGAGFCANGS